LPKKDLSTNITTILKIDYRLNLCFWLP